VCLDCWTSDHLSGRFLDSARGAGSGLTRFTQARNRFPVFVGGASCAGDYVISSVGLGAEPWGPRWVGSISYFRVRLGGAEGVSESRVWGQVGKKLCLAALTPGQKGNNIVDCRPSLKYPGAGRSKWPDGTRQLK
jgi:hypothetical protein